MKTVSALALVCAAGAVYAQPAGTIDLGALTGDMVVSGFFDAGQVAWYSFTVGDISAPIYLDLSTNGSTNPDGSTADTELGLYDFAGNFMITDDDDGIGLTSVLTFGAGSGLLLGDSFNLGGDGIANGEDGNLGAGTYYLAIGEFNTIFGTAGWGIDQYGDEGVNYTLSIYHNVPAPGALGVLGVCGLVSLRRRR
ncbi:MAG: hypothetical protein H6810_05265 [Phycisphaeraceae bacterium]|nr:MAG: hypothetical protein H6810_05265 [Phycisphaeraceae bacterium]